jgi:hypothetical protein
MIDKDLVEVRRRLQVTTETCIDEVFDLSNMRFGCTDEEMYLEYKNTSDRYHFKASPNNPNDAKIIHAHKQFCKIVGVPYSFFKNNRPAKREDIVNDWLGSLAATGPVIKLAKIRKGAELRSIRALLPENHTSMTNADILSTIIACDEYDIDLDLSTGDSRDDLALHTRVLIGPKFYISDEEFRMGLMINASELGASDIVLEVYLYHVESKTAFIGKYGGESYFHSKYTGIQPNEIKEMLPDTIARVYDEAVSYKSRVEAAPDFPGVEESCSIVANMKKVPNPFKRAIYLEASSCHDDMDSMIDFARHMSLIAKDYDTVKRMQVEKAAGSFLGLSFDKV